MAASIPTGCEDRDTWTAKSGAWDRWQKKQEQEARMLELYPALTMLTEEKRKAEQFLRDEL